MMMQYLSLSPTNRYIDYEVGDLFDDVLGGEPDISYVQYNVELETKEQFAVYHSDADPRILQALEKFDKNDIERLRNMDAGNNVDELLALYDVFAAAEVKTEHFQNR